MRIRDLTPNDPHDVPPEYPTERLGCGCAISPDSKELAFTENLDPEPAISTNADIFTLDLTNPAAKPVKVSTSPGGDLRRPIRPMGNIWRGVRRLAPATRATSSGCCSTTAPQKTIKDLLPKFDNWVDEFAWGPDVDRLHLLHERRERRSAESLRSINCKLSTGKSHIHGHRRFE